MDASSLFPPRGDRVRLDSLPVGMCIVARNGAPMYVNRAATSILGRPELPHADLSRLSSVYDIYRAGSGEPYPADALPIVRALRGEPCAADDLELRDRTPPLRLSVWAAPLCDASGHVTAAVATFVSTSGDGKRARQSTSDEHQARHLEILGELAAGVAHEINTPMQYIGDNTAFLGTTIKRLLDLAAGFERLVTKCRAGALDGDELARCEAELAKSRLRFLRDQAPSAVDQTLAGIDQVRSIVQALKEFSHPGDQREAVDLNHLAKTTMTITRNVWRYHADLCLELDEAAPLVSAYPQELGQVLVNLVVNATHAIEERAARADTDYKGRIVIRTETIPGGVRVSVEDNGAGIDESIRDRIMEPFFTTKGVGKGTGQGLALARQVIIERHGGKLDFESTRGQGTTFFIELDRDDDG